MTTRSKLVVEDFELAAPALHSAIVGEGCVFPCASYFLLWKDVLTSDGLILGAGPKVLMETLDVEEGLGGFGRVRLEQGLTWEGGELDRERRMNSPDSGDCFGTK